MGETFWPSQNIRTLQNREQGLFVYVIKSHTIATWHLCNTADSNIMYLISPHEDFISLWYKNKLTLLLIRTLQKCGATREVKWQSLGLLRSPLLLLLLLLSFLLGLKASSVFGDGIPRLWTALASALSSEVVVTPIPVILFLLSGWGGCRYVAIFSGWGCAAFAIFVKYQHGGATLETWVTPLAGPVTVA